MRKEQTAESIAGVTLEQYAKVKARLDVEATRPKPRSLGEILDEVGIEEERWADASARWSERVNDESAARLRQGWLSKRFPPPIAYGVAYAVAVERELNALAAELPAREERAAGAEAAAGPDAPRVLPDTLPRPGDSLGLPLAAEGQGAAPVAPPADMLPVEEAAPPPRPDHTGEDDTAPTTKERARPAPLGDRPPSLADPARPFRAPNRPSPRFEAAERSATEPAAAAVALGRLDPDGATLVGVSPPADDVLPFRPPMLRLDPDGETVTGVVPHPAAPLPFSALPFSAPAPRVAPVAADNAATAAPSEESEDPDGTLETIPPVPAGPPRLDPRQRLDPDGATVLGAELRDDPPLPFDTIPKRS